MPRAAEDGPMTTIRPIVAGMMIALVALSGTASALGGSLTGELAGDAQAQTDPLTTSATAAAVGTVHAEDLSAEVAGGAHGKLGASTPAGNASASGFAGVQASTNDSDYAGGSAGVSAHGDGAAAASATHGASAAVESEAEGSVGDVSFFGFLRANLRVVLDAIQGVAASFHGGAHADASAVHDLDALSDTDVSVEAVSAIGGEIDGQLTNAIGPVSGRVESASSLAANLH